MSAELQTCIYDHRPHECHHWREDAEYHARKKEGPCMTETPPSVTADDGSHWRLINNEWVGWSDGEEWTESEAAMEQYFPEVVQRWNDLTKEQP